MPPIALPDPPLADARVRLRALEDADVDWIVEATADPLIPRFTSVPKSNSAVDVRAFVLSQRVLRERGEEVHLLGVEAESGARAGPVGLHHVDWRLGTAEIGYWTAREQRGRGLTTARVRLMCAWAFGSLGLERIELQAHVENLASQHVAERLGFVREGVKRGALPDQGDGRASVVVYGLLPGELR